MSGKDFLDEFAEDEIAEQPVEQLADAEMEPVRTGPQRGSDGKFIKAEAQAEAERAEKGAKEAVGDPADVTEPPSDDEEGGQVPLAVVKALRKELQELKRAQGAATQTQKPQTKAPEIRGPSVSFEQDPRAYIQDTLVSQKTQMSMFMASQQEGEETVQAAWQAFDEACRVDPLVSSYSYQLLNHPHPVGEMVKWYKEQQELRAIREAGGIENLIQQRMAMGGQQPSPQAGRPNVPPSLAGTGKPRTSDATGEPTDGFDALFKR